MNKFTIDERRFIIVAGKGGVGRTTVSAAFALLFARKGWKTLLATSDNHDRTLTKFFGRRIDSRCRPISDNLWAVNIQPMESIKEYALMILKIRYLQHLLLDTPAMQSFIVNIPGITEWSIMGKITYHLIEKRGDDYAYDRIILDAPPVGHSLSLIKIPLYISKVIPCGPLHNVARERLTLINDPRITGIFLVVIPEELIVSEALEMASALRQELSTPILGAIVNRVLTPLFTSNEEDFILDDAIAATHDPRIETARFRIRRTRLQRNQIDRLEGKLPLVILPEMDSWQMNLKSLTILADALENAISACH